MKVNNIESGNYQGYVWKSNEKEPTMVSGSFNEDLSTQNPFIIEGFLYDEERHVSYSIKYADGEYLIYRYEVDPRDFRSEDVVLKNYYAHRMKKNHKKLAFLQYWREQEDPLCEGMKVLQPAELVFVGFNDKEE